MQEVTFLNNNAIYWKKAEHLIENEAKINPDDLIDLYIRLTDDLAYAKTFYPQSKTYIYLNNLTTRIHQRIYNNKKIRSSRIKDYWLKELPLLFFKHRKKTALSLFIFFLSFLIGVVSSANDKTFDRFILGDNYIDMTLENIKKNDPLAVYKKMNEVDMFLGITFNNIKVSFITFISGVALSFGSAFMLFKNGIMLGTFQYFFYQKGLLVKSLLVIWIHGTLEISAIIMAGGAGFVLGNSILFPGTFSRKESFIRGAAEGMKIVVGLVPVFIIAGFLEGFVTRYTSMPVILSMAIILCSLSFVFYYFIIYPGVVFLHQHK